MKRIVLVLTEAEARGLALALGNSLDAACDAKDVCGAKAPSAQRGYQKLIEAIRGAMPAGAVVFTGAEREALQIAISTQEAGVIDGVEEDTPEYTRLGNATGSANQKMPDGAFMAIPMQAPKAKP